MWAWFGVSFAGWLCPAVPAASVLVPGAGTCNAFVRWLDSFLEEGLPGKVAPASIERGHALGLVGFVQAEEGGVDDFVFERASVLTFYTFQQRTAVEATTACGYQPALGASLC
jgi:hypothetical protein